MDSQELINAGLTANQAQLYVALLKQPEQSGGELSKKVSLDRSFTYNILKTLEEKGLVTHITRDNKRVYLAAEPENLLTELDEQRKRVIATVEKLKTIKQDSTSEMNVQVYEGKAGLKAYVREVLKSPYFYTLGGGHRPDELIERLKYDFPHIMNKLIEKKIDAKTIMRKQDVKKIPGLAKAHRKHIRTIERPPNDISFVALKDKIAIWSSAEQPFSIIIKAPGAAEALKVYFEQIWSQADKI